VTTSPGDPAFTVGALGIVAFDYSALGEDVPDNPEDPLGFPDFVFWVPDALVLFEPDQLPRVVCTAFAGNDPADARRNYHDAVERLSALVQGCEAASAPAPAAAKAVPATAEVDLDDEAYCEVVSRLREEIARGEIYQIVPSRIFRTPCTSPIRAYGGLRQHESSPYRFFVSGGDFTCSAPRPETSVRSFATPARRRSK
jgi:anthranilate synthase component 1